MRAFAVSFLSPLLLACAFWAVFGACVDVEVEAAPPRSRVLVAWDALACRDPHRVVIELAAVDDDAVVQRSVPCAIGWMALDVPHLGGYHARVESWWLGEAARVVAEVDLDVEVPIVRWTLEGPP